MTTRILVAQLAHESNGLVASPTGIEDFVTSRGEDLLARRGDGSALAGVIEAAAEAGWELVPAISMHAWPSGPADDRVVGRFLDVVRAVASDRPIDGAVLVMHGAMLSRSHPDVEGQVLGELRRLPDLANVPIVIALDLHGNITEAMATAVDAIIAYRRNPHDDLRETGARAVAVLSRLLACRARGRCVRAAVGVPLAPGASATADEPMRSLEAAAREVERSDPRMLEAAIFAGFPYAEHADNGMSCCVSVEAGAAAAARGHAERLASLAREKASAAAIVDLPSGEIVDRIRRARPGVVVVAEPADNVGGGAYGDGTGLLRELIDAEVGGPVLIAICDPAAVAAFADAAPGERRRFGIGGRSFRGDAGPLEREWTVVSRSDGVFALEDPRSPLAAFHGQTVRMGPCAVVSHGSVRVLLTSRPTAPWDLGQWRSQGLDPARARVIGVKAAAAHRLAYQPIASEWLSVATPGPCPSDPGALRR